MSFCPTNSDQKYNYRKNGNKNIHIASLTFFSSMKVDHRGNQNEKKALLDKKSVQRCR